MPANLSHRPRRRPRSARALRLAAPLAMLPALAACQVAEGFGFAEVGAIPVLHRSIFDVVWSGLTGRDCSVVRLDTFQTYCRPIEPPPAPPPYCTRSLARVDCWRDLQNLPRPTPPQVADGPMTLTPMQEADRVRRWPPL